MKTIRTNQLAGWAAVLALFSAPVSTYGQGQITFFNYGYAYVGNGLTGDKLPAGDTFLVALYYAPDGTTDENAFLQLGDPIGFFAPGLFHGTPQTVPNTPCHTPVMAQVRAWESAFGSTYAEAVAAPPLGAVYALVGGSDIVRVFADGCPPAGLFYPLNVHAFSLYPVPEPDAVLLMLVGLVGACCLRNRWLRCPGASKGLPLPVLQNDGTRSLSNHPYARVLRENIVSIPTSGGRFLLCARHFELSPQGSCAPCLPPSRNYCACPATASGPALIPGITSGCHENNQNIPTRRMGRHAGAARRGV